MNFVKILTLLLISAFFLGACSVIDTSKPITDIKYFGYNNSDEKSGEGYLFDHISEMGNANISIIKNKYSTPKHLYNAIESCLKKNMMPVVSLTGYFFNCLLYTSRCV